MQHEYSVVLHKLKKSPRKPEYIKDKKIFWTMQKNNDAREIIINAFKDKIIPLYYEEGHLKVKMRSDMKMVLLIMKILIETKMMN